MCTHIDPDSVRMVRTPEEAWWFTLGKGMPVIVIPGNVDDLSAPGTLIADRFALVAACETLLAKTTGVWIGYRHRHLYFCSE